MRGVCWSGSTSSTAGSGESAKSWRRHGRKDAEEAVRAADEAEDLGKVKAKGEDEAKGKDKDEDVVAVMMACSRGRLISPRCGS